LESFLAHYNHLQSKNTQLNIKNLNQLNEVQERTLRTLLITKDLNNVLTDDSTTPNSLFLTMQHLKRNTNTTTILSQIKLFNNYNNLKISKAPSLLKLNQQE